MILEKLDPLALVGLLIALIFFLWLYRVSSSEHNTYSLSDLITTGGRMDLSKVGQLVAMISTTWVFIHMEMREATVEWYAGLYMLAWIGARFGSLYAKIRGGAGTTETTMATPVRTETVQPTKEISQ